MDTSERRALARPDWSPPDVDPAKPSVARTYNWFLGGAHNFEADRELGLKILAVCPFVKELAVLNRRFGMTAARELAQQGVTQYIDLGAGIPAAGAVHEIVREHQPDAKVVYVDTDPVAVAHGELMLAGIDGVEYIDADLTDPSEVFDHDVVQATLDPEERTAVFLCAALHLVPDSADPAGLVEQYRRRVAAGSWLVFTHGTKDGCPEMDEIEQLYREAGSPYYPRTREQCEAMMAGTTLMEPGFVLSGFWRCDMPMMDAERKRSGTWVGVGQWP